MSTCSIVNWIARLHLCSAPNAFPRHTLSLWNSRLNFAPFGICWRELAPVTVLPDIDISYSAHYYNSTIAHTGSPKDEYNWCKQIYIKQITTPLQIKLHLNNSTYSRLLNANRTTNIELYSLTCTLATVHLSVCFRSHSSSDPRR